MPRHCEKPLRMPGVRLDFPADGGYAHQAARNCTVRAPDGLANGIIGYDVPAVTAFCSRARLRRSGLCCAVSVADGGVLQIDRAVPSAAPAAAQLGAAGALQKVPHAKKQPCIMAAWSDSPCQAPARTACPRRRPVPRENSVDVRFCPQGAEQPSCRRPAG